MDSSHNEQKEPRDEQGPSREEPSKGGAVPVSGNPPLDRDVVVTNDPVIVSNTEHEAHWRDHPHSTVVVETNRIHEPETRHATGVVIVPYSEVVPESQTTGGPRAEHQRDEKKDDDQHGKSPNDEKNQEMARAPEKKKSGEDHGEKRDRHDRHEDEAKEEERPAQIVRPRPLWQTLLFAGIVALICGVLGAFAYSYFFGPSKSDEGNSSGQSSAKSASSGGSSGQKGSESKSERGNESASKGGTAKSIPGFTKAQDADTLSQQNERLSDRIDALKKRVDDLSAPQHETPPDVHTLQIKVEEMARTVEDMTDLAERTRRMENRLEDMKEQIRSLRSQVSSIQTGGSSVPKMEKQIQSREHRGMVPNGTDEPDPSLLGPLQIGGSEPNAAMGQAMALFRNGRYVEALNMLRSLQVTRPDDARVWYYSALAQGLVTGKWGPETVSLVEKGAAQERSGHPFSSWIDADLVGLTGAQGKDWLNTYRNRLVRR